MMTIHDERAQVMRRTDAAETPARTLEIAITKGYPVYLDDPRREEWSLSVKTSLNIALAQEAITRLVKNVDFLPRDSMRYPTTNQSLVMMTKETRAACIGTIATTSVYLQAHKTFQSTEQLAEAFNHLSKDFGDFSLADWGRIFHGIKSGKYVKVNYRLLLPELVQAFEAYADEKVDQRERMMADHKRYYEAKSDDLWRGYHESMKHEAKERKVHPSDWLKGEDVLSWAQKAVLQARDQEARKS